MSSQKPGVCVWGGGGRKRESGGRGEGKKSGSRDLHNLFLSLRRVRHSQDLTSLETIRSFGMVRSFILVYGTPYAEPVPMDRGK